MVEKKLLTKKQTAEFFSVNVRTLENWSKNGTLIPIKIGGSVYYTADSINELFNLPNTSSDE